MITHHRTRRPERDVQDRNLATKSQFRDEVTSLDSNTIAITSQLTRSHNPQPTSHKPQATSHKPQATRGQSSMERPSGRVTGPSPPHGH